MSWDSPDLVNREICLECSFDQHQACKGALNKRERAECPCACRQLKKAAA